MLYTHPTLPLFIPRTQAVSTFLPVWVWRENIPLFGSLGVVPLLCCAGCLCSAKRNPNGSCTCCWYHFPSETKSTTEYLSALELRLRSPCDWGCWSHCSLSTPSYRRGTGELIRAPSYKRDAINRAMGCCLASWSLQDPRREGNSEWETATAVHSTSRKGSQELRQKAGFSTPLSCAPSPT